MSEARTAFAGPPRKRFFDDNGITLPPHLETGDEIAEFTSYSNCIRHGRLRTNLCERCLARYAEHLFKTDSLDTPIFPGLAYIAGRITPYVFGAAGAISKHSPTLVKIAKAILKGLWIAIRILAQVAYSCIVCFVMMWFVQPSMSPAEQEQRDRERERKRKEDDAWRARRDADHEAREREQIEWLEKRDADYQNRRREHDDWHERREADYRKSNEEQEAWEKRRDEDYRKKLEDYRKWDDERIALAEASSIATKMGNSNASVANDARLLDEIKQEVREPELTNAIQNMEEEAVEKRYEKACDSMDKAENEWDDVRKRDTKDGSRIVRFRAGITDAVNHLNDADEITKGLEN